MSVNRVLALLLSRQRPPPAFFPSQLPIRWQRWTISSCPCRAVSPPPWWVPVGHQTLQWACTVICHLWTLGGNTSSVASHVSRLHSGSGFPGKHKRIDCLALTMARDLCLSSLPNNLPSLQKREGKKSGTITKRIHWSLKLWMQKVHKSLFHWFCTRSSLEESENCLEHGWCINSKERVRKRKKNMDFGVRQTHLCSKSGSAKFWLCVLEMFLKLSVPQFLYL